MGCPLSKSDPLEQEIQDALAGLVDSSVNQKVREKIEDIAKELIRIKLLKPTTKGFRTEVAEVALDAIGVVYCKCVQDVKKVQEAANASFLTASRMNSNMLTGFG